MTAGSLRLFVAASLPDDHLDWIGDQTAELRHRWPEARWTPRYNQHVTLKFLGSTPPERLDDVTFACRAVAAMHGAGPVAPGGLGLFPSPKRARVLWIGLEDPGGLLGGLARGLAQSLAELGFEQEKRSFSPHLTIARFQAPARIGDLPLLSGPPEPFQLASFDLWRSRLSPQGARYERLASFGLAA